MSDTRLYRKIRKIFQGHYICAFRKDLNPEVLDCLVYMAEEIERYVSKNYVKKAK